MLAELQKIFLKKCLRVKVESNNRKIRGATSIEYNGIKFKSILECSCYKKLETAELDFSYESEKITLWDGVKLQNTLVYAPKKIKVGKYGKFLEPQTRTLLSTTYTPDFVVIKGNYKIYFDVKGKENDTYPIKKKMFLKTLAERNEGVRYIFFEPHNVRQMLQAIEIIKKL